jgi:hypothetical protein
VTADAESLPSARSVSAPLGVSASRVHVPDAGGAGDDPLATDLDGRIAAARHLAGSRRDARRRTRAGLIWGAEGGVASAGTATHPPRAVGQGAAHAMTLSPRPLIDLLQAEPEVAFDSASFASAPVGHLETR